MSSDYEICLFSADPTPLPIDEYFSILTDTEPHSDPMGYARVVTLADGTNRNLGFLKQVWHWDGLSEGMRNTLYSDFANKQVLVRTKNNAGTFGYWTARFVWPEQEPVHDSGYVLDLSITLMDLVASDYTEPE